MTKQLAFVHQNETNISASVAQALAENLTVGLSALSDKNRLQYEATFRQWQLHAEKSNISSLNFDLVTVRDFLVNDRWSFNTRKTKLAHIRKFAELLALSDVNEETNFSYNFGRLSLLKPKTLGGKKDVLPTIALTNRQVFRLFDAIASDSNADTRNRAILALMLFCGLRSSEVVSLKWRDIQYTKNVILVRQGKGSKSAFVPTLGDTLHVLREWQETQKKSGVFEYVCVSIFRSDKLSSNVKCSTRMISTLVKNLQTWTGIKFRPHDTRRTAITELLSNGASVSDVRDFARHKSGQTTLIYAQSTDATNLNTTLGNKLKYGRAVSFADVGTFMLTYECDNGHTFYAMKPSACPKCGNEGLLCQQDMFND